jgi:hypothetical protein
MATGKDRNQSQPDDVILAADDFPERGFQLPCAIGGGGSGLWGHAKGDSTMGTGTDAVTNVTE